jgi:hypothetical protein
VINDSVGKRLSINQDFLEINSISLHNNWQVYKKSDNLSLALYQKSSDGLLTILQLEDEWFYCQLIESRRYVYYKCDGFEGLVSLLKDLEIIKKR